MYLHPPSKFSCCVTVWPLSSEPPGLRADLRQLPPGEDPVRAGTLHLRLLRTQQPPEQVPADPRHGGRRGGNQGQGREERSPRVNRSRQVKVKEGVTLPLYCLFCVSVKFEYIYQCPFSVYS